MGCSCTKKEVVLGALGEVELSGSLSSHCSDVKDEEFVPNIRDSPVKADRFPQSEGPRKVLFIPSSHEDCAQPAPILPVQNKASFYKDCFAKRIEVLRQNSHKKVEKTQISFEDGSHYSGQVKHGLFHGLGTVVLANGKQYTGEWVEGRMHGRGVYTWPDGRRFEGEYVRNKMHGRGLYKWPDGKQYEGEFKNGHQHGLGTYSVKRGGMTIAKKGQWVNGQRVAWLD